MKTVAFAGSPEFAAVILARLQESPFPAKLVLTQPDRPTGRGRKTTANPVKTLATQVDLPVLQPTTLRQTDAQTALQEIQPDVLVVAAYGLLLPPEVLSIPTYGCINVHASLLPRWRGAAPIERAVMAGDQQTGVAIMQMEEGLDTGPVYASQAVAIADSEGVLALERRLAVLGAELLIEVLGRLPETPVPQSDEGICYAHKLTPSDRVIDWRNSANQIARQVWALSHRMPAHTQLDGVQIQLLKAKALPPTANHQPMAAGTQLDAGKKRLVVACGNGCLEVEQLKINRGKGAAMNAAAARNGYADVFSPGRVFTAGQPA